MRGKKYIALCLLLSLLTVSCIGCDLAGTQKPLSISGFAFNTTYTFTLYQGGSQELLDRCVSKCSQFEEIFSRTRTDSELYRINQIEQSYLQIWQEKTGENNLYQKWDNIVGKRLSMKETERLEAALQEQLQKQNIEDMEFVIQPNGAVRIPVSEQMYAILEKGLEYSKLSDGCFDITIDPVSRLWDFSSGEGTVPVEEEIQKNLPYVGYQKIRLVEDCVEFAMPGMGIDLGGIAKGYIADRMKEYLVEEGVTSGMINLGGNVLCIGKKSEKESFHIGIQQPFADRNETIAAINADDISVVSSGIYERYIESEGHFYHHILNPKTGYSYDNDLIGVTIVSDRSVDGDGLSTVTFALGLEQGMKLVNSMENVEALFITEDEKSHYSDGLAAMLYE